LTDEVYAEIGNPVDPLAVAAALKTSGWRDEDPRQMFDEKDLFVLGDTVYSECKRRARDEPDEADAEQESGWRTFVRFARHYGEGYHRFI
jgi:hypothetical protein